MPLPLDTVVKQLNESGVIAPGKLEHFVPPNANPKDGETLLRDLYKQNLLTKFQAQQVAAGKAKSLLLGNYLLLDRIGAGGMGQVFKATHRRLKRVVAIKTLPAALLRDASAVARFQREVEAAAKLRHPNVVATDDADEAGAVHFLVMEYVEGKDLSALVKADGPLPVDKAVNYTLQAARGLEYAHKKGVIHRDIKASNLLLDSEGTIKVLDMGLARIESRADAATQAELTGTGAVMGTVDYMAPEQSISTKHADARSDIYSLGCTLYFLLTGKPPYDGDTVAAKLVAHHTQPIPDLAAAIGGLPKQLSAVFQKMVAKQPPDRFQTMGEVIAAIESLSEADLKAVRSGASGVAPSQLSPTRTFQSATIPSLSIPGDVSAQGRNKLLLKIGAAAIGLILASIVALTLLRPGEATNAPLNTATAPVATSAESAAGLVDAPAPVPVADEFVQLFNGRDLSGWTTSPAWRGNWKVENGSIVGAGDGTFFLFSDKTDFTDFHLRVKARVASGVSAGIVCRVPMVAEAIASGNSQVLGFTAKLNANNALDVRKTGSLYVVEPYSNADGKTVDKAPVAPDVWCELELLMRGDRLVIKVDGATTTDYTDAKHLYPRGGLALQFFNGSGALEISKIEIKELTPADTGARSADAVATISKPTGLAYLDPAFQQWVTRTQQLSADQQIEAVSKKLVDLNPKFDGKVTREIVDGVVTELKFLTDEVTDISPVRALPGLTRLNCSGSYYKGRLSDLSPLKGLSLETVNCDSNKVTDLSPLKGMPLKVLDVSHSDLSDLTPLQGMKLTTLYCSLTKVTDVSPLRGMPLERFECQSSPVVDISPFEGMPLKFLNCGQSKISEIAPVRGMPLTTLICFDTMVSDLTPLEGMSLESLTLYGTQVSDLKPLEHCKYLRSVVLGGSKVTAESVADLRKALPNCQVSWDDPAKAGKP